MSAQPDTRIADFDAAELEAAIQWRAHRRACSICGGHFGTCRQGVRLIRACKAAAHAARLARRRSQSR